MKILLIEDDRALATLLKQQLKKESFAVDVVYSAQKAKEKIENFSHEYDCLLMDINLPDGDGFELCDYMRGQKNTRPIIMMTARDSLSDKVKGLDLGADDYITKPFAIEELIARIRAVIRRNSQDSLPILEIADLKINPQTRRVKRDNQLIELSSKEFAVLEFLARHSDQVVTRTMIMEHVWGSDFETFSNVIDVYLKTLRKKIDKNFEKKLLHTIRGSGYSLSDQR